MQWRYNLAHLALAGIVALCLAPLMVCVDVQARIAFSSDRVGNLEIYVMDAEGKNQHRLTNNSHDDWSPSWSPDGRRIAFASERDGHVDVIPGWFTSEIYVMDNDGKNQQRLTENRRNDLSPSWSPDGDRIAFASDGKGTFENFEIYVMDAVGKNPQRLTNNPDGDWNPSWSPDGKRIAFVSKRDGNPEIYVMDADGGNQQNLTNNPHVDVSPAWFVPAFSVAPAGKP